MIFRRFGGVAFVALLLATGATAQTVSGLSQYLNLGRVSQPGVDSSVLDDLSKYYRLHANVRLGREQRLANGVAWRLLTDVRTRATVPRLTWMADQKSLLKANELFDALHGAELAHYDAADLERRRLALYEWSNGKPPDIAKPYVIKPEVIAVTYATSRLVSYVEVTNRSEFGSARLDIQGRVLDLERGHIWEIDNCPPLFDGGDFSLGDWLDVCGDEAYKKFYGLWLAKSREAASAARARGANLEMPDEAAPIMRASQRFALYLTPAGLALVDKISPLPPFETVKGIVVNPVVLRYSELGSFMKPGPWRDDVLGQAISR